MSTLKADTIQSTSGGAATLTAQQGVKAFANQDNGTSLNESFNVSSLTDNSTGRYELALTNAFSNANYATSALCSATGGSNAHYNFTVENQDNRLRSTTSLRTYILNSQSGEGTNDALDSSVIFHGDLA